VASESDSVIAVAAGTGSTAAALLIGVMVVIVVLRNRRANAKGIIAYFVLITMIIFQYIKMITRFMNFEYKNRNDCNTVHAIEFVNG
jgi:hypothetical protein